METTARDFLLNELPVAGATEPATSSTFDEVLMRRSRLLFATGWKPGEMEVSSS